MSSDGIDGALTAAIAAAIREGGWEADDNRQAYMLVLHPSTRQLYHIQPTAAPGVLLIDGEQHYSASWL